MNGVDLSRPDYHSYLLRLWGNAARTVWHASLQSAATEQIDYFPSLEALVAFLVTQLAAAGDDADARETAIEDGKH
jgi:hypothetical protein